MSARVMVVVVVRLSPIFRLWDLGLQGMSASEIAGANHEECLNISSLYEF